MSRLDEIQARLDAATPGPWVPGYDAGWTVDEGAYPNGREIAAMTDQEADQGRADADFIAHSREDLAALVEFARAMDGLHRPRKVICLNPSHSSDCDAMVCDTCDTPYPCPTANALEQIGGAS